MSTAGSNLTGITKDIYNAVKCMAKAVAAGEQTSTVVVLEFQNANMSLSQLGITQDEISQKALSAMLDQLGIDIPSAIHALRADCPFEMFWTGLRYSYRGCIIVVESSFFKRMKETQKTDEKKYD